MRYTFVTLSIAAGLAVAQVDQLDKIPKCAYTCVSSYITGSNIAGCKTADIACVCSNKDFIAGISCCLGDVCNETDIQATIKFAAGICNANGVQTPDKLICNKKTTSSSASSSTATATATASHSSSSTASTASTATSTTSASGSPAPSKTNAASPVLPNSGGLLGAVLAVAALL